MKSTIGLIFGGKSSEHEVSLQSANNIFQAMDKDKYNIKLIGIDKNGDWLHFENENFLLNENDPTNISLKKENAKIISSSDNALSINSLNAIRDIDVAFSIIHGSLGEDGSMQGLFRIADVPYVGPDVLGSSISMDKDIAKRLLNNAGLDVADSFTFTSWSKSTIDYNEIEMFLGSTLFIKPANQGSSVGVSKSTNETEFWTAVEEAFLYDTKILIEEAIVGREIECAVLGNQNPRASLVGEVLSDSGFYSYEEKYIDAGATTVIPANIDPSIIKSVQKRALMAFEALSCEGMARVDFFLTEDGRTVVNELNTLPGFTNISMYPKLWEATGLSYSELIDELIELAIERHERNSKLLKI